MRKRERENPCWVCGHFHKYEEGEMCGICGHHIQHNHTLSNNRTTASVFPSEILPDFLFLGTYDNASRSELLRTQGISHLLNTVPSCQNLYRNSFIYHCLPDDKSLPFDDANQFLEQCEKDKSRVLVHCMSGKNRSPAIVIAYLMKIKGWKLPQSCQWVKERRPSVHLSQAVYEKLQEYELKIFGSETIIQPSSVVPSSFSFGFPKTDETNLPPDFNCVGSTSTIFSSPEITPRQFTFGSVENQNNVSQISFNNGQPTIP